MKYSFVLFLLLAAQCRSRVNLSEKDLSGAWKADSVYRYANGFIERKPIMDDDENIVFDYDGVGKVTMKKDGEQRSIGYQLLDGDSLQYIGRNGRLLSGYRILAYSSQKLVLRKMHPPLFSGKNQLSYEIRLFSPASTHRP